MTERALGVNSLWSNLERLLAERVAPGWAQVALGVRGGFGDGPDALAEYALPEADCLAVLRARSGLVIGARHGRAGDGLAAHLATGAPAIVAVDSHDLPYRPAYGRVHSGRTIVVRPVPGDAATVAIDDRWTPGWAGLLPLAVLERARWSAVAHDPVREPVFAGVPLDGAWWSVDHVPAPPADLAGWLAARLDDLHRDATGPGGHVCLPADRLVQLAARLPHAGWDVRRAISLRLRAELSPRAYTIALLRVAAQAFDDALLRAELERYAADVRGLADARELLTKSLALARPQYVRIAAAALDRGARAERRLAAALAPYRVERTAYQRAEAG